MSSCNKQFQFVFERQQPSTQCGYWSWSLFVCVNIGTHQLSTGRLSATRQNLYTRDSTPSETPHQRRPRSSKTLPITLLVRGSSCSNWPYCHADDGFILEFRAFADDNCPQSVVIKTPFWLNSGLRSCGGEKVSLIMYAAHTQLLISEIWENAIVF